MASKETIADFNKAASTMVPGDMMECPSIFGIAGASKVLLILIGVNDKQVHHLNVTWCGVKIGDLYGKPGQGSSWRYVHV